MLTIFIIFPLYFREKNERPSQHNWVLKKPDIYFLKIQHCTENIHKMQKTHIYRTGHVSLVKVFADDQ